MKILKHILFSIIFTTNFCYAQDREHDSLALVDLYNSTGGDNWTNKTNWLQPGHPISDWFGITVSGGRVVQIDLRPTLVTGNNLIGTLPSSLGNLTELRSIYISFNQQLTGPIPTTLYNLIKLQYFFMIWNQLSGSIPEEVSNLSNLKMLWLANNQLSGTIPFSLGAISTLEDLNLENNQLSGAIPAELGNLVNLTRLDLSGNKYINGIIPANLGSITGLELLDLRQNNLSGTIPPELFSLADLEYFFIGTNNLSGTISPQLGDLTKLKYLDLGVNDFEGVLPSGLGNLSDLVFLSIAGNQFTDLPDFSTQLNPDQLYIQENKFTFEDIEPNVAIANDTVIYEPQDSVLTAYYIRINEGQSATFSSKVGGVHNIYQWKKDGADILGANDSTYSISPVTKNDGGRYSCEIANTVATSLTLHRRPIDVMVNALPTLYTVTGGGSYCYGTKGVEVGLDGSDAGVLYFLLCNGSTIDTIMGGTSTGFDFQTATGVYTVIANTPMISRLMNGSVTVEMEHCSNGIWIPNSFSPHNKDGINDDFRVQGENIALFKLEIYNKWGQKIFESTNISDGWNGKYKGKECDSGVYVYHVEYTSIDGRHEIHKGRLTLL